MIERTLSLIKPDAVRRNLTGEILAVIQGAGLKVVTLKMIHMTKAQAGGFYAVHRERPFFDSLTDYMSSGPVVCSILEGEGAIHRYRELIGATSPEKATEETIRKKYTVSLEANSVHGSDAPGATAFETRYFFSTFEVV